MAVNIINYEDHPYGFISPNGRYHSVEWGEHTEFAYRYIDNNGLESEFYKWWKETTDCSGSPTDYLVYGCGWLLLHSPGYGLPYLTSSKKEMTKEQRETLFDYYVQLDMKKEANALYK